MTFITKNDINAVVQQVTGRRESLFSEDWAIRSNEFREKVSGSRILVIGGAGTIGASFIRRLLGFQPAKVCVVDTNENGLTELVRDLRSTPGLVVPDQFTTYPMDFGHPLAIRMTEQEGPFDIVANFAALKHVRSEKNAICSSYMIYNNVIKAGTLFESLIQHPPRHFFCVSTDKAANPINVMGASKKWMEKLVLAVADSFPATTARFANVAFSNGSLLDGFLYRFAKQQPLSMPLDIKRYFVSEEEAGQLCALACITGETRDIFTPVLDPERDLKSFVEFAEILLDKLGYEPVMVDDENHAKELSRNIKESRKYPCFVFSSNTSGEKVAEEFVESGEDVDDETYTSIKVVKAKPMANLPTTLAGLKEADELLSANSLSKQIVVEMLKREVSGFKHHEINKYLDQKM